MMRRLAALPILLAAGCCSAPAHTARPESFTSVRAFPALWDLSPGLDSLASDLRRAAPPDAGPIFVVHSSGWAKAASSLRNCRTLVLLEPFPLCVTVPPGPSLVIVAGQRPAFVSASCPVVRLWVPGIPLAGHLDVCRRVGAERLAAAMR